MLIAVGVAGREQPGEPGRRAGLLLLGVPPGTAVPRPAAGEPARRHRRVHPAHRVRALPGPGQR